MRSETGGSPPTHQEAQSWGQQAWRRHAWQLLSLPLLLFFTVPVLLLFFRVSPADWWDGIRQQQVLQAVGVSLKTTLISLLVTVVAGTPLAYLMGRHRFRFKRVVDTLIDLPTVLPPSVAGVALLMALGRRGLLGGSLSALGVEIAFTQAAVVIAQVFISAPFFVRSASIGFASVDHELEQAAQLDGASRWEIFRYIVFPLSEQALFSGSMMSWSRALGEFGATIIFAGNFPGRTQTMPIAIYLGFESDLNIALTLSVILVSVSFVSILLVKLISRREDGP
jgi:molybdate transport system permease protein